MTVEEYAKQQKPIKNDVPFSVTVGGGPLPEHVEVAFSTTGFEGGDGSVHELTLTWGAGGFEPELLRFINNEVSGIQLKMRGDWELEGVLDALIALGDHLRIYRKNATGPFGEPGFMGKSL